MATVSLKILVGKEPNANCSRDFKQTASRGVGGVKETRREVTVSRGLAMVGSCCHLGSRLKGQRLEVVLREPNECMGLLATIAINAAKLGREPEERIR